MFTFLVGHFRVLMAYDFEQVKNHEILENQLEQIKEKRIKDYENYILAKNYLINGNLKFAKFYLNLINENETTLKNIKIKYLSLISFIEGDFEKSYEALQKIKFSNVASIKENCLLTINLKLGLNQLRGIEKDFEQCEFYNSSYAQNEHFWPIMLREMKKKNFKFIDNELLKGSNSESDEFIRQWLKIGLYLNKENEVLKNLGNAAETVYKSKKNREILGLIYYRANNKDEALSVVEDLDGPNAENLKGTLALEKQEYEVAYGHFKLALHKKPDSQNALERALPLSWLLGQWHEGPELIEMISNLSVGPKEKLTLDTAYRIQLGQHQRANMQLKILEKSYQKIPFEVTVMKNLNSLLMGNVSEIEESSQSACKMFDGMSCWLNLTVASWPDIHDSIKENQTYQSSFDLDRWKLNSDSKPIKEESIIDQRDIDELDDKEIKIH